MTRDLVIADMDFAVAAIAEVASESPLAFESVRNWSRRDAN